MWFRHLGVRSREVSVGLPDNMVSGLMIDATLKLGTLTVFYGTWEAGECVVGFW